MKKRSILTIVFLFAALMTSFAGNVRETEAARPKTYTVTPNKIPSSVKKSSVYNKNTKNWLQLQYYLKALQKGGGKLVLKKGVYKISNTLYVPSNTTIELKEGAVLKKINKAKGKIKPAKNLSLIYPISKGHTEFLHPIIRI